METIADQIKAATRAVLRVEKDATDENTPRQVFLNLELTYGEEGSKRIKIVVNPGLLDDLGLDEVDCPDCEGTGLLDGSECPRCKGSGRIHDSAARFKELWDGTQDRLDEVNVAWANLIPDALWGRLALQAYKL